MSSADVIQKPFAVPVRGEGRRLLGNMAVSRIYEEAAKGNLELVKNGHRTLITTRSIDRYTAGWQPAKIKLYAKKKKPAD
jgi:hypothetical protein